jgi:hypothetical protein
LYRVDETIFEEFLYFSLDHRFFSRIDRTKLMSNQFDIRISHDFLFDNSWVDAWHFLIRPGKNVA